MNKTILLATFIFPERVEWFLSYLETKFSIGKNKVFCYKNLDDESKVIMTFKLTIQQDKPYPPRPAWHSTRRTSWQSSRPTASACCSRPTAAAWSTTSGTWLNLRQRLNIAGNDKRQVGRDPFDRPVPPGDRLQPRRGFRREALLDLPNMLFGHIFDIEKRIMGAIHCSNQLIKL